MEVLGREGMGVSGGGGRGVVDEVEIGKGVEMGEGKIRGKGGRGLVVGGGEGVVVRREEELVWGVGEGEGRGVGWVKGEGFLFDLGG